VPGTTAKDRPGIIGRMRGQFSTRRGVFREMEPSPLHLLDRDVEALVGSEANVNDAVMVRLQQVPFVVRYDVQVLSN